MKLRSSLRLSSDENGTNGRSIENSPTSVPSFGAWKMV